MHIYLVGDRKAHPQEHLHSREAHVVGSGIETSAPLDEYLIRCLSAYKVVPLPRIVRADICPLKRSGMATPPESKQQGIGNVVWCGICGPIAQMLA
jgi:hypothetical protein